MSHPVKIPADVDREDRVIGPLTARQLALLAAAATLLYGLWALTRELVPLPVFLALATPIAVAAVVVALGQRDGVGLDRLLVAAIRHRLTPHRRVTAPEGLRPVPDWLTTPGVDDVSDATRGAAVVAAPLELPATGITRTGVVDLGSDGLALVAACSPVNFALRTPAEQGAVVAAFGRWLHALSAPVQILIRTHRLDLSPQLAELTEGAAALPHRALEQAAREHASFVASLAARSDLLRRQILLVLREPAGGPSATGGLGGPGGLAGLRGAWGRRRAPAVLDAAARQAAETRLTRRLGEAADLLGAAGVTVTALDAGQATAVLAAACNPDTLLPPSAALAGADEVITTPAIDDADPPVEHSADHDPDFATEEDPWD